MIKQNVFEYTVYAVRVDKAFCNFKVVTGAVFDNYINECKGNLTQVAAGGFDGRIC